MKKFINRNYFWSNLFADQLYKFGIEHVCISPGSRNTPLTLAFANNKKFKKYIHIDERSSGFFALGIAKKIRNPVVLVTTSGTAVAELYPAVIESFNQRIPLIICTADRPPYLRNTGANQTINQENIYKNHIRFFYDFGLPTLNKKELRNVCKKISEGISIAIYQNPGPIHLNFPFKKPLEPESFSDEIKIKISDFLISPKKSVTKKKINSSEIKNLFKKIEDYKKGLIFCAWDNFENGFFKELTKFSGLTNLPILTDGTSELRFTKLENENVIVNHSSFLQHLKEDADFTIQFGNAPSSASVLRFLENTKAEKFILNKFGNLKDPSRRKAKIISVDPIEFLKFLNSQKFNPLKRIEWKNQIQTCEKISENIKYDFLKKPKINIEPTWPNELIKIIPVNSNLFISNSLPIRDFDYFVSKKMNNIKVFTNRGASGIDGIISTASGIASQSNERTFLVIGDLAFYHNLSALATLKELEIPLIIILVNNNGGGIFKMLPVAKTRSNYEKYFNTPHNLDFSKIVKSFGGNYFNPKTWHEFHMKIEKLISSRNYSVIDLKTDSVQSLEIRKKYWHKVKEEINIKL